MDPRTFEKLYGLRYFVLLGVILILGLCGFVTFGGPAMAILFGSGEVTVATPAAPGQIAVVPTVITAPTTIVPIQFTDVPPTAAPTDSVSPTSTTTTQALPTAAITPTLEPTAVPTTAPQATTPNIPGQLVVCTGVSTGLLNFRESPTRNSQVISVLPNGKKVGFIEKANTFFPWFKIDVDGIQGYSYGAYLCKP